ncbi:MAG TPA: DUF3471 domain-containing protein, partial [Puia sp.]|nr:DUF3471 domain-containing protein [Puia sp.]
AMYSTTEDLYRWDRALYTNQLLQDSSLQKAFTAFIGKHGYGWVIDSTLDNKVLMYDGAILDFTSFMVRVPADHTCIILLDNNRSRGLAKIAQDIYYLLNDQAIDWPRPGEVMPVGIGTLREYTGVYRFAPDFQISVTLENGQLFVQTGKQDKVPLYAESHNLFFTKVVVTELEFSRDDSGQVNQVTLYQDGGQFQGQKVK